MKARTEELLYLLLWAAERYGRPTFRHLDESFEGWAYRRGFLGQLHRLERQKFLESRIEADVGRVHRLTEAGRLTALGGRDPDECWRRTWDGRWRLVVYDVPEKHRVLRNKLRRRLARQRFGYLQNSFWITPDPLAEPREVLGRGPTNVETLIMLEAQAASGESNEEIVAGAWNWTEIKERYEKLNHVLGQRPTGKIHSPEAAERLQAWLTQEHRAWKRILDVDPMLPRTLVPSTYPGFKAWRRRQEILQTAGAQMRMFSPRHPGEVS